MRGLLPRIARIVTSSVHSPTPSSGGSGRDTRARYARELNGDFPRPVCMETRRGSRFATGFTALERKPLSSIIDLGRASNLPLDELISLWNDHHLGRGHIGASMKAKLYHLLEHRSVTCPHFVIPLWKGSGYTNMFIQVIRLLEFISQKFRVVLEPTSLQLQVQVQMPHMMFTSLEDYKSRGTQASPYFTATHYTEFAESKGIVLVRGDVVFTSKLSDPEARWLLETTQSFYLNDTRYKLVERFNKETHEFEFKDVLQTLEMPML